MKLINKLKTWYGKNEDEIKTKAKKFGYCAAGLGVGYLVGKQMTIFKSALGLADMNSLGIIKFFDPSKGVEINVKEACALLKAK